MQFLCRGISDQPSVVDGLSVPYNLGRQMLLPIYIFRRFRAVIPELPGRHLINSVLDETPDQFIARIFLLPLFFILFMREQHPALYIQKRRRHDQKLTGHIHVLLSHPVNVGKILVSDVGDGDVIDVDLIYLDEMQKKIQGAVKRV